MATEVVIPYRPRPQMLAYHARKERWACIVAHRRYGKTVGVVNGLIRTCLTSQKGSTRCAYIAPFYSQAKAIAWDYAKFYSSVVPGIRVNESELRIDYPTGARLRLFGADNYDAMRGLYFDDAALDEPADFPPNAWPTVIRPALADRQGRATFMGTPKGKNEFWEVYDHAKDDPDWFSMVLKASQTGILPDGELIEAKRAMGDDRYEQEFECSFEAAILGAYYGKEMRAADDDNRVTVVPYEPSLPVYTAWDLGIGDTTAIWFAQFHGAQKRIIDFYEASGVGLDHYAAMLKDKPYVYGPHILPHDARVRELGSGKTRVETLTALGLKDIVIADSMPLDDGIQAVRGFLPAAWFDAVKCKRGIEALRQYQREFDEKGKMFRARPMHSWASHAADALRYLVIGYRPPAAKAPARKKSSAWAA